MPSLPTSPVYRIALALFTLAVCAAIIFGLPLLLSRDRPAALHATRPSQPTRSAQRSPSAKKDVHKIAKVLRPKESQYDLEQRMTPRQLLNRWNGPVALASQRFQVPQPWIRAVMAAESGGRTMSTQSRPLTSSAGALGLMQLMPETYDDMRAQHGLGSDPHDPQDNIFAGAAYLRALFLKYGYPMMFSAYNDGPGNLEDRLRDGGLLPRETRDYVGGIAHALESGTGLHGIRVKFTRPNGTPIWIDSAAVISVRAALRGEYAPGVLSVITVGRIRQGVCESVARTRALLRVHGGRV